MAIVGPLVHQNDGGLGYDEGDYYRAISKGFWNNWADADDIPTSQFISTGIAALKGEVDRSEMSRMVRRSGSSAFYRHYHPPVAFYPSMVVGRLFPGMEPERVLRASSVIFMVGWIVVMFLFGSIRPHLFPASILLLPASAHYMLASSGFNMHIPFGLALLSTMIFWRGYIATGHKDLVLRRSTLVAFGLALCLVEYSIILLGGVLLWTLFRLLRDRTELRGGLRSLLTDALWVLGTILIVWPAGIFSLGLLKSYAQQGYIALFRLKDVPAGFDSIGDLVASKFTPSPADLLLLLVVLVTTLAQPRRLIKEGYLAVSTLLLTAILLLQLSPSLVLPWYTFPIFSIAFVLYLSEPSLLTRFFSRNNPVPWIVTALLLFGAGLATVSVESDRRSIEIRDQLSTPELGHLPIVTSHRLSPKLGGYFLTREITGVHFESIAREQLRDSVDHWLLTSVVALPETIGYPGHDTVGGYVLLYPSE